MSRTNAGIFMLNEMKDKLPPSEKKIAEYILEHPEKAIGMTATDLGQESQTSSAAVIRLCKSLNLKGFQELKLRIAGDLQRNEVVEFRDIEPNEPVSSTIAKVTSHSLQTIQETGDLLDTNELNEAVDVLLNSKRVYLFGVGASSIPAIDAEQKLLRINKSASAFTDLHMGATAVANADEDDVVFGISFSGETHEVAKILEIANNQGAKTISLTRYGSSTVAEQADISLFTSATKEATFRSGATSSRMAQLHVIDVLFMCVASRSYNQTVNYLDSTRGAIESLSEKVKKKK
ncbi:MurR/RpiR family transcriptional regulator [Tenuibacillus multivorans]|uniref:DNA-binding transcriptional regulator, MurR/RpiR family, contains HTH and SIS domains n=1 Tax=Tenuibacillus multivorans TaxID=237069 RepID=A0A1H0C591_9BACI|nr:MurR/RpiR family transcriptional regulator [Tenuibacillus multivorans]GEL77770.1 putative HTH-type transcriptional regulator YbbH [Tenuibacillus multivorans]SDN53035.1 DNA-binding transcriptional regulator, MurR/RpiR family, contains HTH and SIS domains [Tenuibacillus multivorans]